MKEPRTPLMIVGKRQGECGSGVIIQAIMLALLIAFYVSPAAATALRKTGPVQARTRPLLLSSFASITAGALIPELFLILFFSSADVRIVAICAIYSLHSGVGIRRVTCRSFVPQ